MRFKFCQQGNKKQHSLRSRNAVVSHLNLVYSWTMWKLEKLETIPAPLLSRYRSHQRIGRGHTPSPETILLTVEVHELRQRGARNLSQTGYDIAIVSGLALGIDTIAHEAAMRAGLPTIAVPGSGLDPAVLYPRTNLQLAGRILAAGGALLSEFAPTFKATDWSFPQRNRIMAGLAQATLLIEAGAKSGTLITARLAADYNREVLVVPGSIFSPSSYGTHQFLKLGATPVTSSEDILQALGFTPQEPEQQTFDFSTLPEAERAVMEYLTEPQNRDHLIEALEISASDANILLMKMEIAGLIVETPAGLRRNF
jgi:DNA processing protein